MFVLHTRRHRPDDVLSLWNLDPAYDPTVYVVLLDCFCVGLFITFVLCADLRSLKAMYQFEHGYHGGSAAKVSPTAAMRVSVLCLICCVLLCCAVGVGCFVVL